MFSKAIFHIDTCKHNTLNKRKKNTIRSAKDLNVKLLHFPLAIGITLTNHYTHPYNHI